jgi:hypothetical protein
MNVKQQNAVIDGGTGIQSNERKESYTLEDVSASWIPQLICICAIKIELLIFLINERSTWYLYNIC